ncbi:MAG: DUF6754 domain-containing protein [Myxococcota bacterium]|nr:DUF6754 domain-containing protein [Myxococcota bacterium]
MIALFVGVTWAPSAGLSAQLEVEPVLAPACGSGLNLTLKFKPLDGHRGSYAVLRSATGEAGSWILAKKGLAASTTAPKAPIVYIDKVTDNPRTSPPAESYAYRVLAMPPDFYVKDSAKDPETQAASKDSTDNKIAQQYLDGAAAQSAVLRGQTKAYAFKNSPGIWLLLILVAGVTIMMFVFTAQVRRGKEIKIRRIPGIDAIEEGIGRATEMGKPVLYVPGIDSLEDIQTIASMLILGEVSKTIAEYQTDVIVSCCVPIVREVADEVVRSGYFRAGHPDAFDPTSVRFIAADQFAFCAGTNGIMYRQKPATNIYLGRFFAESLILAETGYVNQAIQIAGTAEATQLPFFIAACDYTLIGEELFAVSAYLSQDARLVSSLKASDWVKIAVLALLIVGVVDATLDWGTMSNLFELACSPL